MILVVGIFGAAEPGLYRAGLHRLVLRRTARTGEVADAITSGGPDLVPYLGAWPSATPAGMIARLQGPQDLGYVAALYLGLHLLEGYILLPLIQGRAVDLPQALTLVAPALMGEMEGPFGLFVAAPLTVAAMVVPRMLYVEDTLGDEAAAVPGEPGAEVRDAMSTG